MTPLSSGGYGDVTVKKRLGPVGWHPDLNVTMKPTVTHADGGTHLKLPRHPVALVFIRTLLAFEFRFFWVYALFR